MLKLVVLVKKFIIYVKTSPTCNPRGWEPNRTTEKKISLTFLLRWAIALPQSQQEGVRSFNRSGILKQIWKGIIQDFTFPFETQNQLQIKFNSNTLTVANGTNHTRHFVPFHCQTTTFKHTVSCSPTLSCYLYTTTNNEGCAAIEHQRTSWILTNNLQ